MKSLFLCDNCRLAETAKLCAELGYGIEVQSFFDPEYIERNPDAIDIHHRALENIGERALHGPFADLCPGSMDAMVRAVARNRFEMAADIAHRLDISHIVLHHSYIPQTSRPDMWVARCTTFYRDFLKDKPPDMKYHLENFKEWDPILISEVISSVDDPRLDVCLDIGHVHCNARVKVPDWIRHLRGQIGYVHLHDNHGESDEHLGLGQGNIEMNVVCEALNEFAPDAIWAIESEEAGFNQSLEWLAANGFI